MGTTTTTKQSTNRTRGRTSTVEIIPPVPPFRRDIGTARPAEMTVAQQIELRRLAIEEKRLENEKRQQLIEKRKLDLEMMKLKQSQQSRAPNTSSVTIGQTFDFTKMSDSSDDGNNNTNTSNSNSTSNGETTATKSTSGVMGRPWICVVCGLYNFKDTRDFCIHCTSIQELNDAQNSNETTMESDNKATASDQPSETGISSTDTDTLQSASSNDTTRPGKVLSQQSILGVRSHRTMMDGSIDEVGGVSHPRRRISKNYETLDDFDHDDQFDMEDDDLWD